MMRCIDEDGSMCCHLMHSKIDVKMTHYCPVMVVQMDELQSGPLMVKSLTGRCFAVNSKVVIVLSWLYKWMNSKVVPLW